MPHFGLMSTEDSFKRPEGALLRARLHLRGARRRLQQGKIAAGIVTLYDALIFALRFYCMMPDHRQETGIDGSLDLTDEKAMLGHLRSSGMLDDTFDIVKFDRLVERAAYDDMAGYDYRPLLESFEVLMTRLEVLPFDETLLPPEDPATF